MAKEYRITPNHVGLLVHKAKKKPEFLRELWTKQDLKKLNESAIKDHILALIDSGSVIDSIGAVTK